MNSIIRQKAFLAFVFAIIICCNANVPKQLELYHLWGDVHLSKLQIYELKSIWE